MAKRTQWLIGNWKMNQSAKTCGEWFANFFSAAGDLKGVHVGFAVPYVILERCASALKDTEVRLGAQSVHWAESGAFTGEISAGMLKEAGVELALVGHSERRTLFGETNDTVAKRGEAAKVAGITTVFCVGETLEERKSDRTLEVLQEQLQPLLRILDASSIIAYEPVWAIGTGLAATPEQAQETHEWVRNFLTEHLGEEVAQSISLLYGGSMNGKNVAELLAQKDIDGGLVGGASLKHEEFAQMAHALKA